jgi:hypothetical protein
MPEMEATGGTPSTGDKIEDDFRSIRNWESWGVLRSLM